MLPNNTTADVNQNAQVPKKSNGTGTLIWRDILIVYASHWWLFLLFLLVAAGGVQLYFLHTAPIYTRSASVMLKVDQGASDVASAVLGSDMFRTSMNINNEIFTLQSPPIIDQTIRDLNLQVDYQSPGVFRNTTLYGDVLHVSVEFGELNDNESASMMLHLNGDSTFTMSDFHRNGTSMPDAPLKGRLNRSYHTPVGLVTVRPSMSYIQTTEDIIVTRSSFIDCRSHFMSSFSVKLTDGGTSIIGINYEDVSPRRAENILSTVISIYDANWMKDRNQVAASTSDFINDRLSIIERELGSVESDISNYKSEHLIPSDASAVSSQYMGEKTSAQNEIRELTRQLTLARYVRNFLTSEGSRFQILPTTTGLEGGDISGQIGEYNSIMLRRNNIVSSSSVDNPLVQDLDTRLEDLRRVMLASIDNIVVGINSRMSLAQSQVSYSNSRIAASPDQAKYLLNVERQQKVKESLYLFLLQRREENQLSQAFTAYNTRVITPPSGLEEPTSPDKPRIWLFAIGLAIIIPAVLLFLMENMNNSVRGRRDLEVLTIPFIGEIPLYEQGGSWLAKMVDQYKEAKEMRRRRRRHRHYEKKDLHILVKDKSTDVMNEAFRVIRTNLEFMTAKGERHRVLMATSINPNSGKTFVISNLATALAIKGKRVVVVDLDLRKASVSAMVGGPEVGVSDYLTGMVGDYHEVIYPSPAQSNLDVIPVGTIPPNPTELLFEDRLESMVAELKEQYDYVFLDCPPVEIVADATIVARYATMTLFVIRAENFDRSLLPEVQKYYDDNRMPKMSIILNGTTDAFSYYGYHRYGSRYGYYGYGRGGYTYGYATPMK